MRTITVHYNTSIYHTHIFVLDLCSNPRVSQDKYSTWFTSCCIYLLTCSLVLYFPYITCNDACSSFIRSSIANRYVRLKTLISAEAKKLLIKSLFNYLNDIHAIVIAYFHNYDWLCHLATFINNDGVKKVAK